MRMPSTSASPNRRKPQQARAALRRASFLDVAARLIGESGYEAITMTAIAEKSQASIGTLYDYFPDKQTLALALLAQYTEEADAHWKTILEGATTLTKDALADLFVEGALAFVRARPAYLPLLGTPFVYSRSSTARQPLRRTIVDALQKVVPTITVDRAFLSAQIMVELIKGLLAVCKQTAPKDRDAVAVEFKKMMRLHLLEMGNDCA